MWETGRVNSETVEGSVGPGVFLFPGALIEVNHCLDTVFPQMENAELAKSLDTRDMAEVAAMSLV